MTHTRPCPIHFFAVMFGEFAALPISIQGVGLMDSQGFAFHSAIGAPAALRNVPPVQIKAMPEQQLVPWTPARLLAAGIAWLMEETFIPAAAVRADRRA